MSDLYHELLNSSELPLAILQEANFLLLDHNDKFADLCAAAPFQGGCLQFLGFPATINAQLAEKIRHFKAGDRVIAKSWMPMTVNTEPPLNALVQLKFYESSTGHLLLAVVPE